MGPADWQTETDKILNYMYIIWNTPYEVENLRNSDKWWKRWITQTRLRTTGLLNWLPLIWRSFWIIHLLITYHIYLLLTHECFEGEFWSCSAAHTVNIMAHTANILQFIKTDALPSIPMMSEKRTGLYFEVSFHFIAQTHFL